MIQVRTEVKESPIHGFGLFAAEPIPAGTLISSWNPVFDKFITNDEFDHLPLAARQFLKFYGWPHKNGIRIELDGGRYVNYSENPNVRVANDEGTSSYALRDIAAGEEIVEDYAEFHSEFREKGFNANYIEEKTN